MKALFILAVLAITFQPAVFKKLWKIEPLSDDHVEYINSLNTTWRAGHNFKGLKVEQLKVLLGAVRDEEGSKHMIRPLDTNIDVNDLPKNFDSRQKWTACAATINHVRDQGSCGSCWAVAAAGAISDRVCIDSGGSKKTPLSAQDLTSCCRACFVKEGCQGGDPLSAWKYWVKNGLVSGEDYGGKNSCAPYLVEPCEHHAEGSRKKCGNIVRTPKCTHVCTNTEFQYDSDKNYGRIAYKRNPTPSEIRADIFESGPVEAAFDVYEDFLLYKEGIYQVTSNKMLGGHAVVLIGWGEENGVRYWIARNSWNSDWGDKGFFKIEETAAGINTYVIGGYPKN